MGFVEGAVLLDWPLTLFSPFLKSHPCLPAIELCNPSFALTFVPMFSKETINQLKQLLDNAQHVVLTSHARPDGDAIGSSLGMYHFLQSKGLTVTSISPDEVPEYLRFLPGATNIIDATEQPAVAAEALASADVIFCLDYSAINRIDALATPLLAAEAPRVLVDHHLGPEDFFQLRFHDTVASSTCELVYLMIEDLGELDRIDKNTAEPLYTGLVTDTGSFRHSNTSSRVHRIASDLLSRGVKTEEVGRHIYDSYSIKRLKFLGYCLSNKLTILPEYRTAYITITKEEMERFELQPGDREGLVNYTLSLQGFVFGIMITDHGEKVKMSFRSKGDFPARSFAQKFGGGGHLNAAGGASLETLEETEKRLLNLLEDFAREEGFEKW